MVKHPGPFVCPHHGGMTIDFPVFLVCYMHGNLWFILIEPLVCILEGIRVRLNKIVFLRIDKPGIEEKFPQDIYIDVVGYMNVGVYTACNDITQPPISNDVHIQDCKTAAKVPFFLRATVDDLGFALYF